MDTKAFIEKLNSVFCAYNKPNKKYSEIWLSEEDFGGLYHSEKFVLNVKAEHIVESCIDEISEIVDLLHRYAKDELNQIIRIAVYGIDEEIHCIQEIGEILVYSDHKSC